ncbi:hypothetical protein RCH07_003826 [Arthrobacter sp. CG_A4]|nr:hypothetical protein [Arthrobacter sp. CG_A4]
MMKLGAVCERRGSSVQAWPFEYSARDGEDVADACVTLYVHAGIAAADAICAGALGKLAKGQDHPDAIALLASVDKQASNSLGVLLGMKTRAGYGHDPISGTKLMIAERAARSLVEKASL